MVEKPPPESQNQMGRLMRMFLAAAAGGALIVFPFGVWVGYAWRDRISRARRTRHWVDRWEREQQVAREREAAAAALAPKEDFSLS